MAALLVALASSRAEASPEQEPASSAIVVRFVGSWDSAFQAEALAELTAQLERDGLEVRVAPAEGEAASALAYVDLRPAEGQRVAIAVEVRDEVTQKSLRRVVDLSEAAVDSRSLVLSIAASELLAASWAELALASRAEDPPPPAPVAQGLTRRGLPPARSGVRHEVTLVGSTRASSRGTQLFGGAVLYGVRPWPRVGFELGLRGSGLLPIEAPSGRVVGASGGLHLGVAVAPYAAARVRFDLVAAVQPGILWTRGSPRPGATGSEATRAIVDGTVGPRLSIRAGAVWLVVFADAGVALAGVRVRDTAVTVGRYSGFLWSAGVGVRFDPGRARDG